MTKCAIVFLLWVTSLAHARADTDAPACAPEVTLRNASVVHLGNPGIWFDLRVARCMLVDLEALPPLRLQVRLLEERNAARDGQLDLMRRAVSASRDVETVLLHSVEIQSRRALAAEAERDAWYRAPALWVGVGVAGSIAIGVLAAWLVGTL